MSGSPGPGSPQTSRPLFTAGAARSITSEPPPRSSAGRRACTSGPTARGSTIAARTTPLGACPRQRAADPRSRAAAAMRSMKSPTSAGNVPAFRTAPGRAAGEAPRPGRGVTPPVARPEGRDVQLREIVAGDVLDDPAPARDDRAVGTYDAEADQEIAHRAL